MSGEPEFEGARAVIGLGTPASSRPEHDEAFIRAVRQEFPTVVTRQVLPDEMNFQVPHLVLQSTASRLAVSRSNAELNVRFYGDYARSQDQCMDYLQRKITAVLGGWRIQEIVPSFLGVVFTVNYSFSDEPVRPVDHLLAHHVRVDLPGAPTQEALARVGYRLHDRYFVTLTVTNYEQKTLERPMFPGQAIQVKPWEGTVIDSGIALTIDVNNRLAAIVNRADPAVTPQDVQETIQLVAAVSSVGAEFVDSANLDLAVLQDAITR